MSQPPASGVASEAAQLIGRVPPSGTNITSSSSGRSMFGRRLTAPDPRATFTVGTSSLQCEKLQRHCGKRKKLPGR